MDSIQASALKEVKSALEEEIENSQNLLQSSWHLPSAVIFHVVTIDTTKQTVPIVNDVHNDSVKILLNGGAAFAILHKSLDTARIRRQIEDSDVDIAQLKEGDQIPIKPFWYKLGHVFSWRHFWGYLLTILALSLGAPFWFDLLNKLVRLRTGKQVDEHGAPNAIDKRTSNKQTLNRVG